MKWGLNILRIGDFSLILELETTKPKGNEKL